MVPPPLAARGDDGENDDYEYPRKSPKDDDDETEGITTPTYKAHPPGYYGPTGYQHTLPFAHLGPTSSPLFGSPLSSQSPDAALSDTTVASSPGPGSTSTNESPRSSPTDANGYASYPPYKPHSKQGPPIVPMAVVPIVVLAIIGALVFFCLRRRKKLRNSRARDQEMKERRPIAQPYVAPPVQSPLVVLHQPLAPPSFSPATPTAPEPVILGPITTSNNYFTGIDTSDIMSVRSNERTGLGNPFADDHNLDDEPPPPYYPASVPPLSRESSVRTDAPPHSVSSHTALIDARPTTVRSPFDDPGDDAVSEVSAHDARRDGDAMSAVSDLSYQEDPIVRRGLS